AGAFGATHTGSAGGSTVGRSALRRRGTDRSHLGSNSDAGLGPSVPERTGFDGDAFYPRGADRAGFNGEFQTGAPSVVSGAGSTAGRARQQGGGPQGVAVGSGVGPLAGPPSAGSDVSVGSATAHPPPKKARKSSAVTSEAVGSGGALPSSGPSHPTAPGVGEARGPAGLSLSPGVQGPAVSGSKGGGRSRQQPSHSGRSRHDGGSRTGTACSVPSVSATPTPAYAAQRLGPSPFFPTGSPEPSGAHAVGPSGASGASVASSGAAASDGADTWEGICPVCHKGESSECNNMVACDACNQWFHFECVGYSAETHEDDAWFCPQCYQNGLVP
ncbi:PHD-finger domain-containing protein, partial [Toxoplasma gondii GAB2-2007-GAL-DOM2]